MLKKSLSEVMTIPYWERLAWRDFFDVYGPLDWRRDDYRAAAALQAAVAGKDLRDFVLFPEPENVQKKKEQTVDDVLRAFGYVEEG